MGMYYPDDYGPYLSSRIVKPVSDKSLVGRTKDALFRALFQFNCKVLPDVEPGKMLEVGCASGGFLAQMLEAGWQVKGIEFSEKAADSARASGFDVVTGSVESVGEFEQTFDLIVGWMVIEHLHDPVGALRKLASWTRDGGHLAISVPNAASFDFVLFKGAGYALQLPNHLYHFTPKTITALLERSGWRTEKIFHHRVLNNVLGSVGHKLEDWSAPTWLIRPFMEYPRSGGRWALAFYPLAWLLAAFGQTGRMTVWARKAQD